ncbi:magnesium transporter [Staphylococcus pseudintermedius]|uniref:Magnesium transporter MgtE n=6 Tax=Staphylococcus TaxID=1279 RepID=A0A2P5JB12_STAPS|nr:magnesium transporter [Staphylococcus pseudintermedius]ANQ82301.1 magnesium transporter [Staphylococcus pseudintermedius]EGQ0287912.1 magnesium transporter [Staphylococcus pseudintermedius]EGQ0290951.1 magnesium transporter [Staphylococcus pseudintermedius]EGQ0293260.1 magnesium transporter [Staphylococcus pseudintermedius]EGQ0295833.1 magnesium transporter [Staphylococcus pseudintermedius]
MEVANVVNDNEQILLDGEEMFNKALLDDFIAKGDIDGFREEFLALHSYEQSEYFEISDDDVRQKMYRFLSPEEVSEFFENLEIDEEDYEALFETMNATYASQVLEQMSYDNAVDILNQLSKKKIASLLMLMNREEAKEIKALLHYDEDTAGGIMTTEYISLTINTPVHEALMRVKDQAPDAETIYVIFVVDEDKKLVGVISLRDLIIAENDAYIEDIMSERVISANVADDQEDVAQTMRDYDFIAMPVVDYQNHLLGIITIDDIVDVMDEEASEDYSRLAGVSDIDSTDDTIFQTALKRLPWLLILTVLGMITASILGSFEETLEKVALLAAFIPIISGMSGNSGTQSLAVSVRNISTGDIKEKSKIKLALRESGSGFLTGITCAVSLSLIIMLLYGQPYLALIVGTSLTIAMTVGTTIGSVIPLVINRLGIDPAVASGPFITTINDIVSMLIYFGLATTFMSYLT